MYKIIFSATNRTEKCANIFCSIFDDIRKIDLSYKNFKEVTLSKEDFCLIAVPVYGGRVPSPAIERIKKIKANGAKAVLMVVYGNRSYDDALAELEATCIDTGFQIVSACTVPSQHSLMPQIAENRPDNADAERIKKFAYLSKEKAYNGQTLSTKVPGDIPNGYPHSLPVHPKVTKNCTKCGNCATRCPTGAIPLDNPTITNKNLCITCMRCVEICPRNARILIPGIIKITSPIMKKLWGKHTEIEFYY